MMTYQGKRVMVDALLKLLNASPSKKLSSNDVVQGKSNYELSQKEFDLWLSYTNEILDVLYDFAQWVDILSTKINVATIANRTELSYINRILYIEQELLNLAQHITNNA